MKRPVGEFSRSLSEYFASLDKGILLVAFLLTAVGLVAVNTATAAGTMQQHYMTTQIAGIAAGLVIIFVFTLLDYGFLGHFSVPIVAICSVVLLATAFLGVYEGGNTSWLNLGFVSVQPSEFAKIAFILTFSTHVSRVSDSLNRISTIAVLLLHFLAYFIPICIQGDFGTALVYCGMLVAILYLAGLQYRYFLIAGVVIVAAFPLLWNFILKDYHKKRILFSLNPELDPLEFGYQPILSKIAIGSGGLTGLGYGEGVQSQNELLPASHTDFIYSVIGEEFGFIGCIVVLLLMAALVGLLIRAAGQAKDETGRLICFGLAAMFAVQSFMNIGMCIGVTPVIGVTLPFISAGGSSVLSSFCAVGLAQSVRMKPDHSLRFGDRRRRRRF